MAKRQLLGVATCTLALIGGTLVTGTAATAAPAPSETTVGTSAFGTALAAPIPAARSTRTLPTRAEITAAKHDPAKLKAMAASLEDLILDSNRDLAEAEASAMNDQDAYLTTNQALDERNKVASKARTEATKATRYYDTVKKQVGQLAGDLYRNGGINPGVTSMLNDSEDSDVLYKAATMQTLAANRSATLTTAQQAASLWADWQNYAAEAEAAAADADDANRSALEAAEHTRAAYETRIADQETLRNELIGQLAYLRDSDRAQEAKRVAALEENQRQEKLQAELAAAPASPAVERHAGQPRPLAPAPEAVPDVVPTSTSLAPTSKPKAKNDRPATVASSSPSMPAVDSEPRAVAASTPKPVEASASDDSRAAEQAQQEADRKAKAAAQAAKQAQEDAAAARATADARDTARAQEEAAAKQAAAEKAAAKRAAAKKAEQDKAQQDKARQEAAEARAAQAALEKAAAEQRAKEEAAAKASAGSSKESAIAWALRTAADNSNYYSYGGNGPDGWDCSSFTRAAFAQSGISLPRTSSQQYASGTKVPLSQLKRGDLVFSASGSGIYHVAIYLGNGQVVHARNPTAGISSTPLGYVNNLVSYAVRY